MNYTIIEDPYLREKDAAFLRGSVWQPKSQESSQPDQPFAFFIQDEKGQIKGECSGYTLYDYLYIHLLWVDKTLRGKSYGTQLMQRAQRLAKEKDCQCMTVNCMNVSTLAFYKKFGFVVELEKHNAYQNSVIYFLQKNLSNQNRNVKAAFLWIVEILRNLNISWQISGGLAAILHGSTRPLVDIDIDVPESYFPLIQEKVKDYLIYGPAQFKDQTWDLLLMTLNYQGQIIDLSGAIHAKIFHQEKQAWQSLTMNYSNIIIKKCFDMDVPVISKEELISYKKIAARVVDRIDIEKIEINSDLDV